MFRFFASFIVISGAFFIGRAGAFSRRSAINRLTLLSDGLHSMENDIRALLLPLPDAFSHASDFDSFFGEAAKNMADTDAETAVLRAIKSGSFDRETAAVLSLFAAGLSAADAEGQLQNFRTARSRIEKLLEDKELERRQKDKLYGSISVMAGLALVIVFI